MPEKNQTPTDHIMKQAQVFASAWSLVGGVFDSGNAMADAEEAKEELRDMVDGLLQSHVEQIEGVADAMESLVDWHANKIRQLQELKDGAVAGTTIDFGSDCSVTLTEDMSKGMRAALAIALEFVGTLPITLSRPA
ncbi:host nuclease inhibitor protein [Pseudomonas sp.]|uniref:host nuclease inhibitor protein n=1 Tax=Pseudomonas sp. TaxID=306 RepID=UPI00272FE6C7|nr:host nuclease inhibitor protein [Pseudomonas sp.]MDP2244063.1 host nuclease inhibitor protein [Pseudomonas sp.]